MGIRVPASMASLDRQRPDGQPEIRNSNCLPPGSSRGRWCYLSPVVSVLLLTAAAAVAAANTSSPPRAQGMVREFAAVRLTAAKAKPLVAESDENAPPAASGAAKAPADTGAVASRPPLLDVQTSVSGLKRKPQWPAPTPSSKLPSQTPKKPRARSPLRFAEPPARVGAMPTPRAPIKGAWPTPRATIKGVAKPAYGVGASRPRTFASGVSTAMSRLEFPMAGTKIERSTEVPYFELREETSFWEHNNVQV